jgi:hypothetical protein
MEVADVLRRWGSAISMGLFSVVWASLQWDVLRGLATEGPSAVDSAVDAAFLLMLLITLGATVYAIQETRSE